MSIVARLPVAPIGAGRAAERWFAALEDVGARGRSAASSARTNWRRALAELPLPDATPDDEIVDGMVMWTERSDLFDVDPGRARASVWSTLLAASWETS